MGRGRGLQYQARGAKRRERRQVAEAARSGEDAQVGAHSCAPLPIPWRTWAKRCRGGSRTAPYGRIERGVDIASRERFTHAGGLAVNTRYVLLLLAMSICAIALAIACGGGSSRQTTAPQGTVTPTPLFGWKSAFSSAAEDEQDAIGFAREYLQLCPDICGLPDSVEYVRTTVGQARKLFDPKGEGHSWPSDGTAAVVVLAHGDFSHFCMGCSVHTTYFSTFWAVVPIGLRNFVSNRNSAQYNLGELGKVHKVPVPLAPFPTPVALSSSP